MHALIEASMHIIHADQLVFNCDEDLCACVRYTADGADDSHQFAYDMRLVWNNCYAYHGAEGSLSGERSSKPMCERLNESTEARRDTVA